MSILFKGRPFAGVLPLLVVSLSVAQGRCDAADSPAGEDLELRIFVDKYLVEVFANGRQALLTEYTGDRTPSEFRAFSVGAPTTLRKVEVWKLQPANQGFREAMRSRIWAPQTTQP